MLYAEKRVEQSSGYGYLSKMEWFSLRPQLEHVMSKHGKSEPAYPHSILMQEPKDMREKDIEPTMEAAIFVTRKSHLKK
jgi:hypothetical protein